MMDNNFFLNLRTWIGDAAVDKLIARAYAIAQDAHDAEGQVRWDGSNYFTNHSLVVGDNALEEGGPLAQIVGFLHDTIEDTAVTEAELRAEFPPVVVDAVVAMTHRESEGETYGEYMERLIKSPLATIVKKYDIEHNLLTCSEGNPGSHKQRRYRYETGLVLCRLAQAVHASNSGIITHHLELVK